MSNKNFGGVNGKGYYIALILCAAAIGISGYLYYTGSEKEPADLNEAQQVLSPTANPQKQEDLPVVATQPQKQEPTQGTTLPTVATEHKKLQTVFPVEGQIISVYAMENLTYNATTRDWRVHNGVDIAAEEGTVVCASAEGTVYTVYEDDTMGMTVVIRHEDGYVTTYSSLAKEVAVEPGQTVKAGQKIGCAGDTAMLENAIGCHVHFSVSCNDQPVNPNEFLAQE